MRNPNGFGGVCKLPGNRRRPFRARVTVGWAERPGKRPLQQFQTIGYFTTRQEALVALAEYNRMPFNRQLVDLTFGEAYKLWSERYFQRCPSTRRVTESAAQYCRPLWDRPVRSLRTQDLQRVFDGMDGLSRGYQLKTRSLLHQIYEWCIKHDVVFRDYSAFVELGNYSEGGERHVYTPEEVRRLLELSWAGGVVPGEPPSTVPLHLIDTMPVLLYTGLRIGELLALRKDEVHLRERYIQVNGTKTRAARRLVPIHKALLPYLERIMARPGALLFPSREGKQLTYSQYKYTWFDSVMEALHFRHTPHETRHTFISRMDTACIPRGVQKFIAGHADADVTDRYTHKDVPELVGWIDRLSWED